MTAMKEHMKEHYPLQGDNSHTWRLFIDITGSVTEDLKTYRIVAEQLQTFNKFTGLLQSGHRELSDSWRQFTEFMDRRTHQPPESSEEEVVVQFKLKAYIRQIEEAQHGFLNTEIFLHSVAQWRKALCDSVAVLAKVTELLQSIHSSYSWLMGVSVNFASPQFAHLMQITEQILGVTGDVTGVGTISRCLMPQHKPDRAFRLLLSLSMTRQERQK
ncbi:hypothetical protein L218DRAFT_950797 [Marasmius fiardii PR-910]|nr:hypothetical protein L218DRAFT_950797 [Marasmius fiardii PR-910]